MVAFPALTVDGVLVNGGFYDAAAWGWSSTLRLSVYRLAYEGKSLVRAREGVPETARVAVGHSEAGHCGLVVCCRAEWLLGCRMSV